jgi:hypothetical protein
MVVTLYGGVLQKRKEATNGLNGFWTSQARVVAAGLVSEGS